MQKPVAIKYNYTNGRPTSIWFRAGECERDDAMRFENVLTGQRENIYEHLGVVITEDDEEILEALQEMKKYHENRVSNLEELMKEHN